MPAAAPWKLRAFRLGGLAGYRSLTWEGLDPGLNVLVGQNGVGKTTTIEALFVALSYLSGRHARDALSKTYRATEYSVHLVGEESPRHFQTNDVRSIQGARRTGYDAHVLHLVENRQPKNIVGRSGNHWRQNPLQRYPGALSELKRLLKSSKGDERELAAEVFHACRTMPSVATASEWDWIAEELVRRGPNHLRPVSAGQFDLVALTLDLVTFRRNVDCASSPHFVLIDNPEAYLHPACLDAAFDLIQAVLPRAQLFVATHSLSLMVSPRPKTLFWLPKSARAAAEPRIEDVRLLPTGMANAFLELYGTGAGAGVLSLLAEFSAPEFHAFLQGCVGDCRPRSRRDAATDPQLAMIQDALPSTETMTILDFGAGHGDLLAALRQWPKRPAQLRYIAHDIAIQPELIDGLLTAKVDRSVTESSGIVTALEDAPVECDAIVLCNVLHHLRTSQVADLMARLLTLNLRRNGQAGLVIVEVRTLTPESRFIVWDWQDWTEVLAPWPQFMVSHQERERDHPAKGLDATIVRHGGEGPGDRGPTPEELGGRLLERLPTKQANALAEVDALLASRSETAFDEVWRQRRLAYLCAHVTWLASAARQPSALDRLHSSVLSHPQ